MISNCVVPDYWKIYASLVIHLSIILLNVPWLRLIRWTFYSLFIKLVWIISWEIYCNALYFLYSVLWSILDYLKFFGSIIGEKLCSLLLYYLEFECVCFYLGWMSSTHSALLLWNEWCSKEWRSSLLEMSGAPTLAPSKWVALILYSLLWSEREK